MSIVNKIKLAEIVGKSQQTLTTWQKNGMPIKSNAANGRANSYETADVIGWLIQREITARIEHHGGESDFYDYELERGRLTHHQANKTALEEKRLAGELIERNQHEQIVTDLAATIRAHSLAIPTKAAHLFLDLSKLEEIQANLKTLIYELLNELATYEPIGSDKKNNGGIQSGNSAAAVTDG